MIPVQQQKQICTSFWHAEGVVKGASDLHTIQSTTFCSTSASALLVLCFYCQTHVEQDAHSAIPDASCQIQMMKAC